MTQVVIPCAPRGRGWSVCDSGTVGGAIFAASMTHQRHPHLPLSTSTAQSTVKTRNRFDGLSFTPPTVCVSNVTSRWGENRYYNRFHQSNIYVSTVWSVRLEKSCIVYLIVNKAIVLYTQSTASHTRFVLKST